MDAAAARDQPGKAILMHILGLSCFYHDAAACLLREGELVAACQEERFSRIKHDWHLPVESIRYCLRESGVSIDDIDAVAFYEKPFLKFERMLETFLSTAPRGYRSFVETLPSWLKQKLWLPRALETQIGFRKRTLYFEHHLSHAASSFFLSPFDESAVLTVDGVGEWATASYGRGRGSRITLTHEMRFPHSLGLLYSSVTTFLGFRANHDEYKVMGMAPYGSPEFAAAMLKELVHRRKDGSLSLDLRSFSYQYGRRMFDRDRFRRVFGITPRDPGAEITRQHFDIAASLQKVTEDTVLSMAEHVRRETRLRDLCLAGGVALNSVANGRLLREGPFDRIFIQPAAGDAGGALGAAYAAYHHYLGRTDRHPLQTLYLGPAYPAAEINSASAAADMPFQELSASELIPAAARLIAEGNVIGWFQGRTEFGPRALGNRSILADPRRAEMKDIVNQKVKFREPFRPFAPAVPVEDCSRFFRLDRPSPFMLMTVPVLSDRLPAVTHVDGSARVQTVDRDQNPLFHELLTSFGKLTGVPVLMNTSLNIKGEPIALTPADAVRCLAGSEMDFLILGNRLLAKREQDLHALR